MQAHAKRRRDPRICTLGAALGTALVLLACSTSSGPLSSAWEPEAIEVPPPIADLQGSGYDTALRVKLPETPPEEHTGLHNVYHLSAAIVSGSEPHGEAAFAKLREMGIHTILSVDGKVPDAALAAKYGMTYVHVPIQYKGISDEELTQIAKTFREKDGPFYVHCFHGKHRGPAAAAVGRIVVDGVGREEAIAEMRQWCGTSPSYEGLYLAIAEGPIPDRRRTSSYRWDFPSAHPFGGFRQAMIEVSRADDNLKYLSKHGWQPGADHPDVDALNEASKLASALERAARLDEVAGKPADFRGWLDESAATSAELARSLRDWREGRASADAVSAAYKRVADGCTACHDVYRND
jgi:hypothetical protein